MESETYKGPVSPERVFKAALSSVKRRAFSRKQTLPQKIWVLLFGILVFAVFWEFINLAAFIPSITAMLIARWKNLRVLHLKENLIFSVAWIYSLLLSCLSHSYGILYEKIFRHVKAVEFFPRFPYNHQTLTESTTKGEMLKRDSFWKDKLPKKVPSPNFLTVMRIIGSASLIFLEDIPLEYFIGIVGILFLTDYFDGIIARTRNRETLFGKWADPIADYLLLISVFLHLYRLYPDFGMTYLQMLVPQICIAVFFSISFVVSGKIDIPRPVVWGRLKFTLYTAGVLLLLLGNTDISRICFMAGILFAYVALGSYITRKYQETRKESIYTGLLRLCLYSWRIRCELR